jgi:hypothetical protein
MTKKRFPNNWATAEILKQYMKNHRRHAVQTGRMKSRAERLAKSNPNVTTHDDQPDREDQDDDMEPHDDGADA